MIYYLNTFFVYSILGYLLESLLKILFFPNMNNGFLFGPWIPIYGIGTCLIIFIMRLIFNRFKVKRYQKVILLFSISMLSLTILELIGGYLIQFITGKIFWDYSNLKFNIGHYIALEISIVWGICSLLITYILKPLLDKIIKKIPSIITYLALSLFVIDLILTIIL